MGKSTATNKTDETIESANVEILEFEQPLTSNSVKPQEKNLNSSVSLYHLRIHFILFRENIAKEVDAVLKA